MSPTGGAPGRALGAAAEVLAWWVVGTATWLATLSSLDASDVELALAAALLSGVVARAARRAAGGSWRPPRTALTALAELPVAVLADSVRVAAALARGSRGELAEVPVPAGGAPSARGRRAALVWLADATPGSVVLDVDAERGRARVHLLTRGRPDVLGRLSGREAS